MLVVVLLCSRTIHFGRVETGSRCKRWLWCEDGIDDIDARKPIMYKCASTNSHEASGTQDSGAGEMLKFSYELAIHRNLTTRVPGRGWSK